MKAVISALAGRAITRAIETSDFDWRLQLAEASHVRTAAAMDVPGRGRYCNPQAKFPNFCYRFAADVARRDRRCSR